jgi:hypothetical protein
VMFVVGEVNLIMERRERTEHACKLTAVALKCSCLIIALWRENEHA